MPGDCRAAGTETRAHRILQGRAVTAQPPGFWLPVTAVAGGDVIPGPDAVCGCPDDEPIHLDGCTYAGHPNRPAHDQEG